MPRLIDANEILKSEHQHYDYMSDEYYVHVRDIENAPTVDAVEVVRCKDCKHYWKNNPSDDVPVCLASPKDDAFCSEGERREKMYLIDTRKYDDSFLLAKILEKVDITDEEKKKLFKHFEKPEVVDAVPVVHGHWLKNGDRYCECSVCHHEGNTSGADNYCPNCGAKMDEVEE